ncbi:MAG: ABC transporter permease [Psychroserpens sp.]|uniref:ABC transporter permease n=1 Tax=Psychroserpens sp. TaxID=2020870 RepID=UPI003CAA73E3
MIRNYFKIAWRNLKKKKLYAFINIIGLFAGISFALLIVAFIWQEIQVNTNLKHAKSQYILTSKWKDPNMGVDFVTLGPLAENLKQQYPHLIANYYRWDGITSIISNGEKKFREGIQLGDESLLTMYGFNLMHGNNDNAFSAPFSVVITKEKAIKYFGTTDVVGETVTIQNFEGDHQDFKITGVLAETLENTITQITKQADNGFFIAKNSATYFNRANFQDWERSMFLSFIELQPGINARQLEAPLSRLIKNHTSEVVQDNLQIIPIKLTDYYLNRNNASLKQMLFTLSFVGLFIMLMAIINFINIAISHSSSRLKEIGIRKVLGGKRKQLMFQFLIESVVLVSISTLLACFSYPIFSGWFAEIIGKKLIGLSEFPAYFLIVPLGCIILISALVGFYPAFVLSSFKSIDAIKGKLKIGSEGVYLRKFLLGFQYVTALVVLIVALLVTQQLDRFLGKTLGYDKEFVVTAAVPRDWTSEGVHKMMTIRNELSKVPSVESVSLSYEIPNGNNGFQLNVYKAGENPDQSYATQGLVSDENYLSTYQIPLLAGTFLESGDTNPDAVVINETALYAYGFENANDAIGQQLYVVNESNALTIEGVVSDFHFESMQQSIKPQLFFNVNSTLYYRYFSFKLKPGNLNESLAQIQQKWKVLMPNSSFEYHFMDDTLATLYETEFQFKKAAYTASLLALIIALLGIFGLVSLSINKRVKEVGIRKVLGASLSRISFLFLKEFLVILGLSVIIACPLAYALMNNWLSNYAYRISIGLLPFVIGILSIASITVLLIIFQTLKAASTNPIKSLRTE